MTEKGPIRRARSAKERTKGKVNRANRKSVLVGVDLNKKAHDLVDRKEVKNQMYHQP